MNFPDLELLRNGRASLKNENSSLALNKILFPGNPCQVIGLNRAIFPESGQVAVPDSEFCQLEQVAVNGILSNHCLGGPHQSITLFRVGGHIQRFNDRVETRILIEEIIIRLV